MTPPQTLPNNNVATHLGIHLILISTRNTFNDIYETIENSFRNVIAVILNKRAAADDVIAIVAVSLREEKNTFLLIRAIKR